LILQSEKTLSGIQDLDYAEAISSLNLQLVGLQASQQAFTRIQNLSLFNYL
jgi:flagellar hook-associated protein 3 FlgL